MDHECAALTNAYFLAQQERDLATLGQILSEDFILIEPLTGWIITRKTLLQDVNAGLIEATSHIGMRVHDYGNTVIIRGRVDKKGQVYSSHYAVACRYTHVFIRVNDRWSMVAAHETVIDSGTPVDSDQPTDPPSETGQWT